MTKDEEIAQLKESLAAEREFRDACEVGYEAEIKQLRAQLAAAQAAIRAHEERRGYRCEVGGGDAVELFAAISAAVAEAQKPLVDALHQIGLLAGSGDKGDPPPKKLEAIAKRCQKEIAKAGKQ